MKDSIVVQGRGLLTVAVVGATARGESAEILGMDRLVALQHPDSLINLKPFPLAA